MNNDRKIISPPTELFDFPTNDHINILVKNDTVFKAYQIGNNSIGREKFSRELKAFAYFKQERADFVPQLLGSGQRDIFGWLAIAHGGETLVNWLRNAQIYDIHSIFEQFLNIDAWLFHHQVNYLESSPKDFLVDRTGKVRLIDFEYTFLHEPFEQILLERIIHDRLKILPDKNIELIEKFVSNKKRKCRSFLRRKVRTAVLLRCNKSRIQKSIRPG